MCAGSSGAASKLHGVPAAALLASVSNPADILRARIETINSYHMYQTYKYACRGLFERHKLLLSLQICAKRQLMEGKIPKEEWDFFLKGACYPWRRERSMC